MVPVEINDKIMQHIQAHLQVPLLTSSTTQFEEDTSVLGHSEQTTRTFSVHSEQSYKGVSLTGWAL